MPTQPKRQVFFITLISLIITSACAQEVEGTQSSALTSVPAVPFLTDRSLVIFANNGGPAVFATADFSLERTLRRISSTGGGDDTRAAAVALLDQILDGFSQPAGLLTQPLSGLSISVDDRPAEANLNPDGLLDTMNPVALFNRIDLAPEDGRHCGEYRVVYANETFQRFFLIFEGALPNPNPDEGIEGCREVAQFWASLSNPSLSDAQLAARLERAYYRGSRDRRSFIHHAHYGVPFGQIRTNHFIGGPWQLAEYRTSLNSQNLPVIVRDTVKSNPLAEFYADTTPSWVSASETVSFERTRDSFQSRFLVRHTAELFAPEQEAAAAGIALTEAHIVNGTGASFHPGFDEFQSTAQGTVDDPASHASGGSLEASVGNALHSRGYGNSAAEAAQHAFNRAGAMTCGGCHQFSAGRVIGFDNSGSVTVEARWPGTLGFVHVSEFGQISPALADFFVPARQVNLEDFLSNPGPSSLAASGGDIDGSLAVEQAISALARSTTPEESEANRIQLETVIENLRADESLAMRMNGQPRRVH